MSKAETAASRAYHYIELALRALDQAEKASEPHIREGFTKIADAWLAPPAKFRRPSSNARFIWKRPPA